ncbi:TPA: hypothetical protein I7272_07850 [Vibrio parahaemolyticus]|uniref:hypothetical protein n=2 Tax=Vibrio parahaemolyticus TaxID=670 RepID=UPI000A3AA574|nr:hypothetical protein [Vibrio parahaemolyticus]EGR0299628.1 hypothetical protein [Vibrio parahaemolyticus]EJR0680875.1 hypothetical protein [Vibrio parahaemolyticus]EJR0682845.1 hypothetical protein [Vibrio parahaemolyticus]ELA9342910.1 hypothetical protein [Vibrio parahaemolyticus]ELA9345509.1 hypothetical protein [Vibrio parahaemolyticus]
MKKTLFLFALLFTSQAFAEWSLNQNGVAIEPSSNDFQSLAILEYSIENDQYFVSFMDTSQIGETSDCDERQAVREINGQLVKLVAMCDRGAARYYGQSDKGRSFIMNEFKTKNSVRVGDTNYSAIGFTAAMNLVKKRKELEEKAL